MPPKRENHNEDTELARVAREVRDRDEQPVLFDPSNMVFRAGQLLAVIGGVWGVAVGFSNYNHRFEQQQKEIDRLKRQVVYTSEWRSWNKYVQLKNAGKIDLPDPADFTTDRTE